MSCGSEAANLLYIVSTGEIKDIFEILQGIFSIWLPQSGYQMTQRYGLNIYHHIDRNNHHVIMDLCIPVS